MDIGADMDTDTIFCFGSNRNKPKQTETNRNSICFGSVPVFFAELQKIFVFFLNELKQKIGLSKQTETED